MLNGNTLLESYFRLRPDRRRHCAIIIRHLHLLQKPADGWTRIAATFNVTTGTSTSVGISARRTVVVPSVCVNVAVLRSPTRKCSHQSHRSAQSEPGQGSTGEWDGDPRGAASSLIYNRLSPLSAFATA